MPEHYFSEHYVQARARFLDAASSAGAQIQSYPVNCDFASDTAIDVAIIGNDNPRSCVISSGVHGVEGFFGSAVQLAVLDDLSSKNTSPDIRYVLIHAVNPCGFASLSRVNESNVDLNRNFLSDESNYTGAPPAYAKLNSFLNPQTPPSRLEPFRLKALWNIWRHGLPQLKQAVASGQYDDPQGLFFGGKEPSQSMCIVRDYRDSWLSAAEKVIHIDFHTGLGASGSYKLLLPESCGWEIVPWYEASFQKEHLEASTEASGTAYAVSGAFGEWMQQYYGAQKYRFITAEFGTYDVVRVLAALRADNRLRFYGPRDANSLPWVKKELLECFCPAAIAWRRGALESAVRVVTQGAKALNGSWQH